MLDLISKIEEELLPKLKIISLSPHDPVVVEKFPEPWVVLGKGNYAAVFIHPEYAGLVVKVYAPGRPGLKDEIKVYKSLGSCKAYSQCIYSGSNYLILKRLRGITLFDCLNKGIRIPKKVIEDIDDALEYAKNKGLYPHDIHAKNIMMVNERGVVVDVSDFYKRELCCKWEDLKQAYFKIYSPFFYYFPVPIPNFVLETIRKGYRFYRKYISHK